MTVADPPNGLIADNEVTVPAAGPEALVDSPAHWKIGFTDYTHSAGDRRSRAKIVQGPGRLRSVVFTGFRIVGR